MTGFTTRRELRDAPATPHDADYSNLQLYLSSTDKHIVYHLTIQLEALPNWTQLACQRVGMIGGPPAAEFELSDEELGWCVFPFPNH